MSLTADIWFESDAEESDEGISSSSAVMDNEWERQDVLQLPEIPCYPSSMANELKQALEHIRVCLQHGGKPIILADVAACLRSTVEDVLIVRHTPGGTTPAQRMCHPTHDFLVLKACGNEEELIIDVNFRERFFLSRTTEAYEQILCMLPVDFVGPLSHLKAVLRIVCDAIAENFRQHGMPVPPWRKYSSLLSLWDGPAQVDYTIEELRHIVEQRPGSLQSAFPPAKHVMNCEVHLGRSVAPALVVMGFPADKCVRFAEVGLDSPKLAIKPVPKAIAPRITAQQLDKLLGPVHKVKLGRV